MILLAQPISASAAIPIIVFLIVPPFEAGDTATVALNCNERGMCYAGDVKRLTWAVWPALTLLAFFWVEWVAWFFYLLAKIMIFGG